MHNAGDTGYTAWRNIHTSVTERMCLSVMTVSLVSCALELASLANRSRPSIRPRNTWNQCGANCHETIVDMRVYCSGYETTVVTSRHRI